MVATSVNGKTSEPPDPSLGQMVPAIRLTLVSVLIIGVGLNGFGAEMVLALAVHKPELLILVGHSLSKVIAVVEYIHYGEGSKHQTLHPCA